MTTSVRYSLSGDNFIDIFEPCFETWPCNHMVKENGTGTAVLMSGVHIVDIFEKHGKAIPEHFLDYKNWDQFYRYIF